MPGVEHRSQKGLNNRAANSHQLIRRQCLASDDWETRHTCSNGRSRGGPLTPLGEMSLQSLSATTSLDGGYTRQNADLAR